MSDFSGLAKIDSVMSEHRVDDLIALFNALFTESFNTKLVRGDKEPVYIPASADNTFHQVIFAHGYFSSALHEMAHWCLAGEQRRLKIDYGYWYMPDGRNQQQQMDFEHVEIKPQALEWILSKACNKNFSVSIDNLSGEQTDLQPFKDNVYKQVLSYCREGLPLRAQSLQASLYKFYQNGSTLDITLFDPLELD
jgi:elongation factor P hydroxylase